MSTQAKIATEEQRLSDEQAEDVLTIRLWRAYNDPVIYHGRSAGYEEFLPDWIFDAIVLARIRRAFETPVSESISHATVPEVAAHLGSATGDAGAINGKFVAAYAHTIQESARIRGVSLEGEALSNIADPDDQQWQESHVDDFIRDLRKQIQTSLDRRFLQESPAVLEKSSIPQSRWGQPSVSKPTDEPSQNEEKSECATASETASLSDFA
jgi:hypothetical protein